MARNAEQCNEVSELSSLNQSTTEMAETRSAQLLQFFRE